MCYNSPQVQNETEDETSALGLPGEEPVKLEGEDETLTAGPVCTEAVVAVVPVEPERQDKIPELDSQEQTCTERVPSKAPAQEEEEDAALLGVKSTEVIAVEVPTQNEVETCALISETIASEAAEAAEQNVRDGDSRQIVAKDPVPILEPKCTETTESLSQSDEIKGGKIEDAMLKTETHSPSDKALTEATPQTEGDSISNAASACLGITANGSTALTDISPKTSEKQSSLVEERSAETAQELVETLNCQDLQKEESINGQFMEGSKEVFESGEQEAVRGDECCSTAVQQEVLTAQEEHPDSAFLSAESSEAQKTPVPVAAAAVEEHVVAETITPTDTTAETAEPLATTPEQMVSDEVPFTTLNSSGSESAEPGRAEAPQPQVSPAYMNGIPESPQSGLPEQHAAPLSDGLSLTHTEFEADVVPSGTVESQSTKIVLNVIQTAVNKLAETEEAFESEQHIKTVGRSPSGTIIPELLENMHADHQFLVKKEEISSMEQELQQSKVEKHATLIESAEIRATVVKTKDMLLTGEVLEDGQSQNSLHIVPTPDDVSRESVRLQKSALELSTSEDSTKDVHPLKLKEKEVGQVTEISDQHIGQQTCAEREEEQRHLPVEDGKMQTWQDDGCQEGGTSCDGAQSQNSLAPEALNVSSNFFFSPK